VLLEPVLFAVCLAPVVYFDLKCRRIPDPYLALAAAALLLVRGLRHTLRLDQLIGAAAGFLFFLGFWALARNRLGFGDVKLSTLVGFLVGAQGWVIAVFFASLGGILLIGVRLLVLQVSIKHRIAFAPFLVAGAIGSYFLTARLQALI
jgi:prepilin signal peptidase PulO-like enzyme (type II secretory pathway)